MSCRHHVHYAGDFHVLWLGELAEDGLELRALDKTGQLEVVLGAVLHISVGVPRVLNEITTPDTLLDRLPLILRG